MAKSTAPIKFGTDGWRALISDEFTFGNVRVCTEAVCRLLKEQGLADQGLILGYDTRFNSQEFATEVARTAAGNGVKTYFSTEATPTPVVSFNVTSMKAGGAIIITASHNPGEWNGFKYKPSYGGSASPEVIARLESHISHILAQSGDSAIPIEEAVKSGLLHKMDFAPAYLTNLESMIDLEAIRSSGLRVVIDSMHGAGAHYLSSIIDGGPTTITELRADPDPSFPGMEQPEPIVQNLQPTVKVIKEGKFDVGLATDGDADRLGILDENGVFITTLQSFSLLCLHQLSIKKRRGPIVKSLTQSSMINRLGERYKVPVHTTQVGFKYLGPAMMQQDALAAGEESGGYAFRGNIPERDGIFSAMLFLELMVRTGRKPSELVQWLYEEVGPFYYDRWDVPLDPTRPLTFQKMINQPAPIQLAGLPVLSRDKMDGIYHSLEGDCWGLVRFSGTEPLVRLYAEADSPERVGAILSDMRNMLGP